MTTSTRRAPPVRSPAGPSAMPAPGRSPSRTSSPRTPTSSRSDSATPTRRSRRVPASCAASPAMTRSACSTATRTIRPRSAATAPGASAVRWPSRPRRSACSRPSARACRGGHRSHGAGAGRRRRPPQRLPLGPGGDRGGYIPALAGGDRRLRARRPAAGGLRVSRAGDGVGHPGVRGRGRVGQSAGALAPHRPAARQQRHRAVPAAAGGRRHIRRRGLAALGHPARLGGGAAAVHRCPAARAAAPRHGRRAAAGRGRAHRRAARHGTGVLRRATPPRRACACCPH